MGQDSTTFFFRFKDLIRRTGRASPDNALPPERETLSFQPIFSHRAAMDNALTQAIEAMLLSTAEPISFNDFARVFAEHARNRREAAEADADAPEVETDGSDGGDGASGGEPSGAAEQPSSSYAAAEDCEVSKAQLREALDALKDAAETEDRPYRIQEGPQGFQLVTAPRFADHVRLLRGSPRPARLSPAALETLSIVAYRQPVTRAEMEAIRGVSVDSALNKLMEWELVRVTGRAELPGRPIQYGTTETFLEFTGIRSLEELPASDVLSNRQIDEWMRRGGDPAEEVSDGDVGLPEEPNPEELPLEERFVDMDWQRENTESDAAGGAAAENGDEGEGRDG